LKFPKGSGTGDPVDHDTFARVIQIIKDRYLEPTTNVKELKPLDSFLPAKDKLKVISPRQQEEENKKLRKYVERDPPVPKESLDEILDLLESCLRWTAKTSLRLVFTVG